jgi:hypothetical protein
MARNERCWQQALQRKAARRKEKQQVARREQQVALASPRHVTQVVRQAAGWPVYECLISRDWQRDGADSLVQIIVGRRSPAGQIAAGVFLVDLGCLGVKNAFARLFDSPAGFADLVAMIASEQPLARTSLNLAARVVREAISYAHGLGFSPHPDYHAAAPLLEGADPDADPTPVPLGKDGKPFFVAGPHDNVPRIMARLTRAVGPDGFHYLVPLPASADPGHGLAGWEDEDAGEPETACGARPSLWSRIAGRLARGAP